MPELHIRQASVEDNDDIEAVYETESNQLKQYYGQFFFSELVEASNEKNKVLVADRYGRGVGCLAVTSDIGFDRLRSTHHIGHFTGLSVWGLILTQKNSYSEISEYIHR